MGFVVIRVPNKYKTNSPCSLASGLSLSVTVIKLLLSFSLTFVKTEKTPSHMHITLPDKCHKTWNHWIVPSKDAPRKLHFTWSLCQNIFVCFVKVCPFHGCAGITLFCMFGRTKIICFHLSCLISSNIWWFNSFNFVYSRFNLEMPIYVNMVRDPVERVISWYYYIRSVQKKYPEQNCTIFTFRAPWYFVERKRVFPELPLPNPNWLKKVNRNLILFGILDTPFQWIESGCY